MSWEEEVADDWEAEVAEQDVVDNWEDDADKLFNENTVVDKRVECPICHGAGKVTEEEKIRVEDRMKSKASTKSNNKPYDENKGVMTIDEDTPLDDPIAEKERLKRISENADAKILDEMFGGKADDAFISDIEKGLNMITLKDITDYQQLAYKLGKKFQEVGNATNTLEFLQSAIRQCGGKLTSDDFQKLSSTCNVMKEERKKEEKVSSTKKGKKKGKTLVSMKKTSDTWQDQLYDENGGDYDDDFM